jgi:predicted choloylglycine hydrolase
MHTNNKNTPQTNKIDKKKKKKKNPTKTQRINETKSWFFEKTNEINEQLANLTKMRR